MSAAAQPPRPARARGPQRSSRDHQISTPTPPPTSAESDEVKQLRRKYADKLVSLKELFPKWSDEDLLTVMAEVNGSLEVAVGRISEGKYLFFLPLFHMQPPATTSVLRDFASRVYSRGVLSCLMTR